jgi:hypothetical protein
VASGLNLSEADASLLANGVGTGVTLLAADVL